MDNYIGKIFISPLTRKEYGVIRQIQGKSPSLKDKWKAFAEDESGNYFAIGENNSVGFWDHETENIEIISQSFDSFRDNCVVQKPVELDKKQVKSVWVDPDFAKKHGIKIVSKDRKGNTK